MMWQLQDYLNYLLGADGSNLVFAILCLWAVTGRWPVLCAVVTALVHLALVLM